MQPRRPRRIWRVWVGGVIAAILLVPGWLLVERYRGKAALAKYERELIAKGEKLTFAELVGPVAQDDGRVAEFIRLAKSLQNGTTVPLNSPPAMQHIAPGKAIVVVREAGWHRQGEKKTFRWEDAAADLEPNGETLGQLRELARGPGLRSRVDYQGMRTRLIHVGPLKSSAQWLSASALHHLHREDVTAAIDDIEAIVLLSRVAAEEPWLISQLVRLAALNIAMHGCWPALEAERISDGQLARLQSAFQDVELVGPMVQAMRGERVSCRDAIRGFRAEDKDSSDIMDMIKSFGQDGEGSSLIEKLPYSGEIRGAIEAAVIIPLWKSVWSFDDERHTLEEVSALLEVSEKARQQRSALPLRLAEAALEKKASNDYQSWRYWATSLFIGGIAKGPMRAFSYETQRQMTLTAVALKRYHLRHGRYPAKLEDLAPKFLREVPVDWMDGQPLRYRVEGESFRLWSIGEDGKDDGGTPDQSEPYGFNSGADMVWPQPASEGEVEEYYKRKGLVKP